MVDLSILMSTHNRTHLFRRTLYALANRPPSIPFELVVVDDNSTEDILAELRAFSVAIPWTFCRFDSKAFEEATCLKKFHNNSAPTQNLAYRLAQGNLLVQLGQEVISFGNCIDQLLTDAPKDNENFIVFSTTLDMPQQYLDKLDHYGTNLGHELASACERWPLQSRAYRSDVTNYISLTTRHVWEQIGGFDERYYGGISSEDSDFVRRARTLPNFKTVISEALSIHQSHSGKTCYYSPPPEVITQDRWDEGVRLNHAIYNNWTGEAKVDQGWPAGTYGIGEIIRR